MDLYACIGLECLHVFHLLDCVYLGWCTEFLSHFGFQVEAPEGSATVASAVNQLRFYAPADDVRQCLRFCRDRLQRALLNPNDAREWRILAVDDSLQAHVLRLRGGSVLLSAIGLHEVSACIWL